MRADSLLQQKAGKKCGLKPKNDKKSRRAVIECGEEEQQGRAAAGQPY